MEIEVVVPVHASEFNFDSTSSSPYITAPSSPIRFGNFFLSAPTSPSRSNSSTFQDFNISSGVPFDWEEKPGTPKNRASNFGEDFEFDFSGQLERNDFSAADELFQGGKIRPLKPPPGYDQSSRVSSPKSPRSPRSPRSRVSQKNEFDPFEKAIEETRKREESSQENRGRERSAGSSSGYVHKGSRSLSPLRVADIMLEQEENSPSEKFVAFSSRNPKPSVSSSIFSAFSFPGRVYKKWKLKDLLLFRSASEGRATATSKDPVKRYDALPKREAEEVKASSFRSSEIVGSSANGSVSGSRRRGVPISAHELHYTANRAVSEELKRKTFLPYKPGWLGCLGFNPGVRDISRVASLTRGGS